MYIGLKHYHEFVEELLDRLETPIHEQFLIENQNEFNKLSTELEEFLELVPYLVEKDIESINKLISYLEEEIFKLQQFIYKGHNYDPTKSKIERDKINELRDLIEDNFYQLSRKYLIPVPYKNKVLDRDQNYQQYLFGTCFRNSLIVAHEDFLVLLGIIITKIREKNFTLKRDIYPYLHLYLTLTNIFSTNEVTEKLNLDQNDVKQDIEHYINLNRLDWLVDLHISVDEVALEGEITLNFAHQLYKLSRDPKEEFLWTMLRVAKRQNNTDLEKLSFDFATLAATLLSITFELKMSGHGDLANAIKNLEGINAMDAIDDLSELYQPEKIQVDQLIKAMSRKLEYLKEFAFQILQMDDLVSYFSLYFNATGANHGSGSAESLFRYVSSLGIKHG